MMTELYGKMTSLEEELYNHLLEVECVANERARVEDVQILSNRIDFLENQINYGTRREDFETLIEYCTRLAKQVSALRTLVSDYISYIPDDMKLEEVV